MDQLQEAESRFGDLQDEESDNDLDDVDSSEMIYEDTLSFADDLDQPETPVGSVFDVMTCVITHSNIITCACLTVA